MQLTTILVAALAATASAVSSRAVRRQTHYINQNCRLISATDPNFSVADLASGTVATKILTFNVGPTAAGPCQLVGAFGAGFPVDQGGDAFSRLDVRALGGNAPGSLVGSFGPLQVVDDAVVQDTVRVINSFQCQESLSFEFAIANDAGADVDVNVAFTASPWDGFFVVVGDQCY
ncbi:hypothetical protein CCHL11_05811 [Colletotrichum chlorophyti]|uniref:Ubiquitin 3 binding protein But2 C-terminal domain-containing protein n=1 Tax=Colletotrichum chlorophyti TaxID=708187 RepID=A0A1Q8RMV0_9PEZI|nr:hypothetical protein CCHL11_05811 [Colletotrichum chlorophyti]